MTLTDEQREELAALQATVATLGHPSFLHLSHREFYQPLIDAGLVEWGTPPGDFDPKHFAGVTITDAGRAALAAYNQEEPCHG